MVGNPTWDFFISYTVADKAWAEWIDESLRAAHFRTFLQARDIRPGHDFLHEMQRAAEGASRTIAVLTPRYFDSDFGETEWRAAFAKDPSGELGALLPVRVAECTPPGLLASRVYIDLVGLDATTARRVLLQGVGPALHSATARAEQAGSGLRPGGRRAPFPGRYQEGRGDRPEGAVVPGTRQDDSRSDNDETETAPEPGSWPGLQETRPRVTDLIGRHVDLLGHGEVQKEFRARLDDDGPVALVLVSGPTGSGKTALVRWLEQAAGGRVVDVAAVAASLAAPLARDGSDVLRLVHELRPVLRRAGPRAVVVFDDVDDHLRDDGIVKFVGRMLREPDLGFFVLCSSSPLPPDLFPLSPASLALDRRRATRDEVEEFLDRVLTASGEDGQVFSPDLRASLFDLNEQTVDFTAVQYVVEMLLAYHQWTGLVITAEVLRRLLDTEQARERNLPAVRVRDGRLVFRRRDKSELLAQTLLRRYVDAETLAEVAVTENLPGFDEEEFLREAEPSLWEAVLSLGLTHSPRDLVGKLLPEEQIRGELQRLGLTVPAHTETVAEQSQRLVRALGYTVVDKPLGLTALRTAVDQASTLVRDPAAETKALQPVAEQVVDRLEAALRDLLHFWGTYLFRSVRDMVREFNDRTPGRAPLEASRLTLSDVVRLLRFTNGVAEVEGSGYRLSFPDGTVPVSADLLNSCEQFLSALGPLQRVMRSAQQAEPAPLGLRNHLRGLLARAEETMKRARESSSYPTVIKLTEIVLDEYGRKTFRGVDPEDREVRFSLHETDERDDLVVAAHYLMLPQRRISVSPHIVPLAGTSSTSLFDRAAEYDTSSETQRRQGHRLLELVELRPGDVVADVGCGTGQLAVEVAERVERVLGLDESPDMVREAALKAAALDVRNVSFEVADLRTYDARPYFDVVLSNSAMHWIQPVEDAYQQLCRLLRPGGRLAVHQGGSGTYRGLRKRAQTIAEALGYGDYVDGFRYPAYYPSPEQLETLLVRAGFADVTVRSEETDGSENPSLIRDFSEAGLLPYLKRLPESQRDSYREEFVRDAESDPPDLYTHRLYATAFRP